MKKVSKLLSVILAGIMLLSVFTVSASAKEMSKTEVVDFYHSILKKTAENNSVIFVKNDWEEKDSADFSALSGLDLLITKNTFSYCDDLWHADNLDSFYSGMDEYCDSAEDSEFYTSFSIDYDLEYGYEVKKATYNDGKIVIELEGDYVGVFLSGTGKEKITATLGKGNVIEKLTVETYDVYDQTSSIKDVPFTTTYELIDNYTFTYEKVPAKSLTLSETSLTMGYMDVAEIEYTVGPQNATFKNVEVYDAWSEDGEVIATAYEKDGKIEIVALAEGTGIVEVYTVSGDILATCEVTVELNFFEKILAKFQYFFVWFLMFFGENVDLM